MLHMALALIVHIHQTFSGIEIIRDCRLIPKIGLGIRESRMGFFNVAEF